jgi:hypothetical protein
MTPYGSARVSTQGQTLAAQDAAPHTACCAKAYAEKACAKTDRPTRCTPMCCTPLKRRALGGAEDQDFAPPCPASILRARG